MAVLTFRTPDGKYRHWDSPACLAYEEKYFYCKFYQDFLRHDGTSHVKCEQCMNLGKHGTDKTV